MNKNAPNIGEKLINDYLFATTRYIDEHGKNVFGSGIGRALSAPRMKTEALSTAAMSFMFAAAGSPALAFVNALTIPVDMGLTWAMHTRDKKDEQPAFFFDTAPERKMPLTDHHIIHRLNQDKRHIIPRLLVTTVFYSLWGGLTYGLSSMSPTLAPFSPIFAAGALSLGVANGTDAVGKWWRAGQALTGKWNVLTQKPEAETAPQREHNLSAAPQFGRG